MSDAAYYRTYRKKNPELIRAIQQKYRAKHPMTEAQRERKRLADRRSYQRHRDERLRKVMAYKKQNLPLILSRNRKTYAAKRGEICQARRVRYQGQEYRERLKKAAEAYRRRVGIQPAGLSGPELVVGEVLVALFGPDNVKHRDRKTIVNPASGRGVELDFLVGPMKLAVEVNGPLHRVPIFGTKKLERTLALDVLKKAACAQRGITLIQIDVEDGQHYARPGNRGKLRRMVRARIVECVAPNAEQ